MTFRACGPLLAVAFVGGCGQNGKSVFSLTAYDFTQHDNFQTQGQALTGPVQTHPVTKGDVVLVEATGAMTTTFGSVDPNGSSAQGGEPFNFINRAAFGFFGRINESVFLAGSSAALIAPQSGNLDLLVNGCDPLHNAPPGSDAGWAIDCTVDGGFTGVVSSKLAPGVTIATSPALTDDTVASTSSASAAGLAGWTASGITVLKGQKLFFHATGTVTVVQGELAGQYGPDGEPHGLNGGFTYQLPNRFAYRLYARVDQSVIDVGADSAWLAPQTGTLEFAVNDRGDSTGIFQISVGLGVVPARGLLGADVAQYKQNGTFTVPADGSWSSTSFTVAKGDPLVFSATGTLSGGGIVGAATTDAFGEAASGGNPFLLTNRPGLALYGRVGTEVFFVGGENALLAPADGTLELAVNQIPDCAATVADGGWSPGFCDVAGSFQVTVNAP